MVAAQNGLLGPLTNGETTLSVSSHRLGIFHISTLDFAGELID